MKQNSPKAQLRRDLHRLLRSMDFVSLSFHGVKLNVEVLNSHRSNSRWFRKHDWTIAADRLVRLEEGGIDVRFDSHLVTVELRKHRRGEMPPYNHFVWELPRKLLKNFPVMLQFNRRRRFTGLVIFKPNPKGGMSAGPRKSKALMARAKRESIA